MSLSRLMELYLDMPYDEEKDNADKVCNLLGNERIISELNKRASDSEDNLLSVSWSMVFDYCKLYFEKEIEKQQLDANKSVSLATRESARRQCSSTLTAVIDTACKGSPNLSLDQLFSLIEMGDHSPFVLHNFGDLFTLVLVKHILGKPVYYSKIELKKYQKLLKRYISMYEHLPERLRKSDVASAVQLLIHRSCSMKPMESYMPLHLFPFYRTAFQDPHLVDDFHLSEALVSGLLLFLERVAVSCRHQVSSLAQDILVPLLRITRKDYQGRLKDALVTSNPHRETLCGNWLLLNGGRSISKESVYRVLRLLVIIHAPETVHSFDRANPWCRLLLKIYNFLFRTLDSLTSVTQLSNNFLQLTSDVFALMYQYGHGDGDGGALDATDLDLTTLLDSTKPSKRRKVEIKLHVLLDMISENIKRPHMIWVWLKVLESLLCNHPEVLGENLSLFVDIQAGLLMVMNEVTLETALGTCMMCLSLLASYLHTKKLGSCVSGYGATAMNSYWQSSYDITFRRVMAGTNLEEGHKLLCTLLKCELAGDYYTLLSLYTSSKMSVNPASLLTLYTLLSEMRVPPHPPQGAAVSLGRPQKTVHVILHWLLFQDSKLMPCGCPWYKEHLRKAAKLVLVCIAKNQTKAKDLLCDFPHDDMGSNNESLMDLARRIHLTNFIIGYHPKKKQGDGEESVMIHVDPVMVTALLKEVDEMVREFMADVAAVEVPHTVICLCFLLCHLLCLLLQHGALAKDDLSTHPISQLIHHVLGKVSDCLHEMARGDLDRLLVTIQCMAVVSSSFVQCRVEIRTSVWHAAIPLSFYSRLFKIFSSSSFPSLSGQEKQDRERTIKKVKWTALDILSWLCHSSLPSNSEDTHEELIHTLDEELIHCLRSLDSPCFTSRDITDQVLRSLEVILQLPSPSSGFITELLLLLQKLCCTLYKNPNMMLKLLDVFSSALKLMQRVGTQMDRENLANFITKIIKLTLQDSYPSAVALKLIDVLCLGLQLGWKEECFEEQGHAILHLLEQSGESMSLQSHTVQLHVVEAVSSIFRHSEAANHLHLFHTLTAHLSQIVANKDVYVRGQGGDDLLQDLNHNAVSLLMLSVSYVAKESLILRPHALLFLIQNLEKGMKYMAWMLGVEEEGELFHFYGDFLFPKWFKDGQNISQFPFFLTGACTMVDFLKEYLTQLLPVAFWHGSNDELKCISEFISTPISDIMKDHLIRLESHLLPLFAAQKQGLTEKHQISLEKVLHASQLHKKLEEALGKEEVNQILSRSTHDLILNILDLHYPEGEGSKSNFLPAPPSHSISSEIVSATLDYLAQHTASCNGNLISFLTRDPFLLTGILMSLSTRLRKAGDPYQCLCCLHRFGIFAELLLMQFQSGLRENEELIFGVILQTLDSGLKYASLRTLDTAMEKSLNREICSSILSFFNQMSKMVTSDKFWKTFPQIANTIIEMQRNEPSLQVEALQTIHTVASRISDCARDLALSLPVEVCAEIKETRKVWDAEPLCDIIQAFLQVPVSSDSLRRLRAYLCDQKVQVVELMKEIHKTGASTPDSISLHCLISSLLEFLSSPHQDVSYEAARCLGELGTGDLASLLVKRTPSVSSLANKDQTPERDLYACIFKLITQALFQSGPSMSLMAFCSLQQMLMSGRASQELAQLVAEKDNKELRILKGLVTQRVTEILEPSPKWQEIEQQLSRMELWTGEGKTHSEWVQELLDVILSCSTDIFGDPQLLHMRDVCRQAISYGEKLLPQIIKAGVGKAEKNLRPLVVAGLNAFLAHHCQFRNSTEIQSASTPFMAASTLIDGEEEPVFGSRRSVQLVLSIIQSLREQTLIPFKKEGNTDGQEEENDKDLKFLLDFDYLKASLAAQYCSSHFLSLLFLEIWCDLRLRKEWEGGSESEGSSPMETLSSLHEDDCRLLQKLLLKAFTGLGDTDGLYGCLRAAQLSDSSSFIHILKLEEKWPALLALYDQKQDISGMGETLRQSRLYHNLSRYMGQENGDTSPESLEMLYECAWRLGQWESSVSASAAPQFPGFHESLFWALKSICLSDSENLRYQLSNLHAAIAESSKRLNFEACANVYPVISQCQVLEKLEKIGDIMDLKETFQTVQRHCNLEVGMKAPFLHEELPLSVQSMAFLLLKTPEAIMAHAQTLYAIAQKARISGQLLTARRNLTVLEGLGLPVDSEIRSLGKLEELKVCRSEGDLERGHLMLASTLKSLEMKPILHAEALTIYAEWMAESFFDTPEAILSQLETACKVLEEHSQEAGTCEQLARAHFIMAKVADAQLKQLDELIQSPDFKLKQEAVAEGRRKASELQRGSLTSKEHIKAYNTMVKTADLIQLEINARQNEQNSMHLLAITHYLKCLKLSDSFMASTYRLASLWLRGQGKAEVNTVIAKALLGLPSYKFVPLLPQLTAHLTPLSSCNRSDHPFLQNLYNLIESCALEHPHHTLPLIFALVNAPKDAIDNNPSPAVTERAAGGEEFLQRLFKSKGNVRVGLREHIQEMEMMCSAYLHFANTEYKDCKNKSLTVKIPRETALLKLNELKHAALLTMSIPINKSGRYDHVPRLLAVQSELAFVGGINAPKRIFCRASNGHLYSQLLKGQDEVLQDAVMQQVFCVINELFSASQSPLHIRTYKVLMLAQRSGVIEWCDNTQPVSLYLIGRDEISGAHARYNPSDITAKDCRNKLNMVSQKSAGERLKTFLDICSQFHPVFRHFFLEKFPEASHWYEKRLAYVRSVAATSIVGYILGIGDRHPSNILIDNNTAEFIHIDLGVAFEQGRLLPTPETVPFRLTRDVVDGMGITGIEGVFRRSCERCLMVLRENRDVILPVLEVLLYDPLYLWTLTPSKAKKIQRRTTSSDIDSSQASTTGERKHVKHAEVVLLRIQHKLQGVEFGGGGLSVEGQVQRLIQDARSPHNLSRLYFGWKPYL
ncbi:unnamed protein product [Darwinula stevensoni]|uniref:non-specific serine/threonine protein kinase n=1 Tax=Darwinula stevensoni TaxID=69355 RepID=A0A7R8XJY1_9CRUS|nr:unnamed protein product [Darwinula stevensoni]CAG0892650.1 unnamed protein product [Darwinula stevensoni]